jgi:hypothetical protein
MRSPSPGASNDLFSVAATSAGNAWAVGRSGHVLAGLIRTAGAAGHAAASAVDQTLILHWNGTRWKRMASPHPGSAGSLEGVGAMSAASAWAVGTTSANSGGRTLILHWNGTRWKRVASPNLGQSADQNTLESVTVPAADNAWAVGTFRTGDLLQTLIEHWNGTSWTNLPSPSPGATLTELFGVGASSARNVWAVGSLDTTDGAVQGFVVHCC